MSQVANLSFAGFDLCGLPTWNGSSVASGPTAVQQRFNLALQDIQTFQAEIIGLP
jgi:hypothetical protein